MIGKLFKGLARTRDALLGGMRKLLGRGALDDETLDRIEELLYTSDLGPAAADLVEARVGDAGSVDHGLRAAVADEDDVHGERRYREERSVGWPGQVAGAMRTPTSTSTRWRS